MSGIFTAQISIYSVLLFELVYILSNAICYIHYNPKYRVFWAMLFKKPRKNIRVNVDVYKRNSLETKDIMIANGQTQTQTSAVELATSSSGIPIAKKVSSSLDFVYDAEKIESKRTAFIFYGLETMSHCILLPLYATCCIVYLSIKMRMDYLTEYGLWSFHVQFCRNGVRYRHFVLTLPNYCFLIFLLCAVVRTEYLRLSVSTNNNKFVYIPIVTMIWCIICALVQATSVTVWKYDVYQFFPDSPHVCFPIPGYLLYSETLMTYNNIQFIFCVILSFISFLTPLYLQRKMLKNLPNSKNNQEIKELLNKINHFQKRIAIPGIICSLIITFCLNITTLIAISNYDVLNGIILGYLVVWVNQYFVMVFIYKDWKQRLFALCYYWNGYKNKIFKQRPNKIPSTSSSTASDVPQMVKEITPKPINSTTF